MSKSCSMCKYDGSRSLLCAGCYDHISYEPINIKACSTCKYSIIFGKPIAAERVCCIGCDSSNDYRNYESFNIEVCSGIDEDNNDMILMPKELTTENGAKGLMIGEFKETITDVCNICASLDEDEINEDCEICHGNIEYTWKHTIEWTTIKEIYAMAVKNLRGDV